MIAACGILAKTSGSLAETGQRKNFQVLDQNETQKLTNNVANLQPTIKKNYHSLYIQNEINPEFNDKLQ